MKGDTGTARDVAEKLTTGKPRSTKPWKNCIRMSSAKIRSTSTCGRGAPPLCRELAFGSVARGRQEHSGAMAWPEMVWRASCRGHLHGIGGRLVEAEGERHGERRVDDRDGDDQLEARLEAVAWFYDQPVPAAFHQTAAVRLHPKGFHDGVSRPTPALIT